MKITSVEPQKHNKEKVNVYIDGEYSFAISLNGYANNYLYKGKELTLAEIEKIKEEDRKELATSYLSYILGFGMKTEFECIKKLKEKDFSESDISYAISKGVQYGYIDDEKYVKCYIHERALPNKWGGNKVMSMLLQKGVNKDIIKEGIEELMTDDILYETVYEVALKKYNQIDKIKNNNSKCYQKLTSFLLGKGYSYSIIKKVIPNILNSSDYFDD